MKSSPIVVHGLMRPRVDTGVRLVLRNSTSLPVALEVRGPTTLVLQARSEMVVPLERGQEIYFSHHGERMLLLRIERHREGEVIEVDEWIARRSGEIERGAH